jgi:nucleoside-diphosphate-sugar epimerase
MTRTAPSGRLDEAVLILGCGYTGAVLAQRLAFAGLPVIGTTRSEAQASVIRTRGAEPVLLDVADLTPLARLRGRVRAVVHSIPPEVDPASGAVTDVTAALLEHFAGESLERFIYISSTSVYGDCDGAVVAEDTPCHPDSPRGAARLAIEDQVLASGLPAVVVRPAGIYGPGRSQLHRMARGQYKLVGDGSAITNRVHVRDLAAILAAAIDRGEAGAVYLATDTHPATQAEVAEHIVATYGLPQPPTMPLAEARVRLSRDVLKMITGSKRLDPSWTLAQLGVRLRFPDYQQGLAAIWGQEQAQLRAEAP